jgi:hypothetical protein
MEERELTQLLQQLGDRVTPGSPPVRRIVDAGEALRGRRSGRVRMFAVAAAAAAVVGGGSVAAVVLDLPSGGDTMSADSGAGGAADDAGGAGAGDEAAPEAGSESGTDADRTAGAAAVPAVVTPDVAGPGDRVQIAVPPDVAFAAEWSLERSEDGAWKPLFVLVDADYARENGAALSRLADEPQVLPDVRQLQDGPVPLVVPDAATPGSYRICQMGDDGTDWCGSLTVTG